MVEQEANALCRPPPLPEQLGITNRFLFSCPLSSKGVERVERQEHTQYDSDTMGSELMYYIPVMGLIGLVVMIGKALWVNKQDAGDANMQELAGYIARGASAFLRAEWKVLGVFAVVAAALLAWSGTDRNSDWVIAIAFLIGAFFSAFAGWIGMSIATKANVRTTQAGA